MVRKAFLSAGVGSEISNAATVRALSGCTADAHDEQSANNAKAIRFMRLN